MRLGLVKFKKAGGGLLGVAGRPAAPPVGKKGGGLPGPRGGRNGDRKASGARSGNLPRGADSVEQQPRS
jgi:hypothetical protein